MKFHFYKKSDSVFQNKVKPWRNSMLHTARFAAPLLIGVTILSACFALLHGCTPTNVKTGSSEKEYIVMVKFNAPSEYNATHFEILSFADVSCSETYAYFKMTEKQLKRILGVTLDIEHVTSANHLAAEKITIDNPKKLNPPYGKFIKNMWIQNDPDFALHDQASPEKCAAYFQ
jgi:hypothetical protein